MDGAEMTIEFAAGEYEKEIHIHIEDDAKAESTESFALLLGNATVGQIASQIEHNVTISDNEEAEDVVFAMQHSDVVVGEKDTAAKITIVRTSGLDYYAGAVIQTVADTAEPLKDYEAANGVTVSFLPGETEKTVEIPVTGDREEGKKFTVQLSGVNAEAGRETTDVYFGRKPSGLNATVITPDMFHTPKASIASDLIAPLSTGTTTIDGVKYDVFEHGSSLTAYTHSKSNLDQTAWSSKENYNITYAAKLKLDTKLSGNSKNGLIKYYNKNGQVYVSGSQKASHSVPDKKNKETTTYSDTVDVTYNECTPNATFQTRANTDGLCRDARYELTKYTSYVPYITLKLKDGNPNFKSYTYTDPRNKTSTDVSALTSVTWSTGSTKELSFCGGNVNICPGTTRKGISITGYEFYAGDTKVGSTTSSSISYKTVADLRKSYDKQFRNAKYVIEVKPIYSVATTKITFDAQDPSVVSFSGNKPNTSGFKDGDQITIQQIDNILVKAQCPTDQEFVASSIQLFVVNNNKETWAYQTTNTNNQKVYAQYYTITDPEVIVRVYNKEPTLTVQYDPDEKTAVNSNVGAVSIAELNDPEHPLGVSNVNTPFKIPDAKTGYGLNGLNKSYLLSSFIDDNEKYKTSGNIRFVTRTIWTYRDQNDGGRDKTVYGDSIAFKPFYADTVINYHFKAVQADETPEGVSGTVYLQETPLFSSAAKPQKFPAVGVQLVIGGKNATTNKDGKYQIDPNFNKGDTIGAYLKLDTMTRSDTISISKNTVKDMTIVVEDNDPLKVTSSAMTVDTPNGDRSIEGNDVVYVETATDTMTCEDATYHLYLSAAGQAGVTPGKAVVRVYDKNGNLRSDVSFEGTFDKENKTEIVVNPVKDKLNVGDTIAVKLYDTKGNGYFEHHSRVVVAEKLSGMYMFNYPGIKKEDDNTFLKALGMLSIGYDFAIDALANNYGTYTDPATGEQHNMMYLGFGSGFSDKDKVFAMEQEIIQNFDDMKNGTYIAQTPKLDDGITLFGGDGGAFTLNIKVGAIMDSVLQTEGKDIGKYAFGDFLIIGQASASVSREWKVPVGAVTLTFNVKVESKDVSAADATGIRWHFYNDSDTPYILSDNSTIDVLASKDISNEGDLCVNMAATGGLNASVLNGLIGAGGSLKVGVEHHSVYSSDADWVNTGKVALTPTVNLVILSKEIPVWKQTWSYNYGSDNAGIKSISERIREEATHEVLFTPTAMSKLHEFEAAQKAAFHTSPVVKASEDVNVLTESVLKDTIAEDATIRMQDLGGGKYLAVFLDAVPGRSAENALGAYYTIFDGTAWSMPQLLEDDGTIDQLPTICEAGSRGYLIAWSDASRAYAAGETMTDSLNALDLTGCFYDPATNTLSPADALTRSTAEDAAADSNPQLVYYNENGTEYMRLYYTKSEFEVSNEAEGEVVGDILNPYQVIAVRNYDFANDTWSEDYSGSARDHILSAVGEEGYAAYRENWYGQEFLDLAPSVEISEELDENGYWKEGTTASFTEKDMSQATVKDGDSIAYNHLSLFAYALDKGGMSQDTNDQNLYLQIYNMHEDEYHHPIQITSQNAEISDIQFDRIQLADGTEATYLYWLENGVVKRINISDLVSDHLAEGTTAAGQHFYYIDKTYSEDNGYEPASVAASAYTEESGEENGSENMEDLSIASYKIRQKNGCNYVVWTQFVPKNDGSDKMELQLFAAREDLRNGEVSMPVQLTDAEDQYISDFDCMVTDNGELTVIANCQTLDQNGDPDPAAAQLRTLHIVPADKLELVSAEQTDIVMNDDGLPAAEITVSAANRGLASKEDVVIEVRDADGNIVSTTNAPLISYETTEQTAEDGSVIMTETPVENPADPLTLVGGEKYSAKLTLPLAEDHSFQGTVNILSGGEVVASQKIEGKASAALIAEGLSAAIESRDHVTLTASIRNASILDSGKQKAVYGYVDENGKNVELGSVELAPLSAGAAADFTAEAEIDFAKLERVTNEDGSLTDSVQFYVSTDTADATASYTTLDLTATAEEVSFMTSLTDLSVQPGEYDDNGNIKLTDTLHVGEAVNMQLLVGDQIAANTPDYVNRTKLVWTDVEGDAVSLDENGMPIAAAEGTATLRGYVVPSDTESLVYEGGAVENRDNYDIKPSAVLIPIEASVKVDAATGSGSGNGNTGSNTGNGSGNGSNTGNGSGNNGNHSGNQDQSSNGATSGNESTNSPLTGDKAVVGVAAALAASVFGAVLFKKKKNKKGGEE